MREWNLKLGDPLSLTLAADARLCTPDYFKDQIWELRLRGGEPAALALQTTYGLRARNMRLFVRFYEGDAAACDPDDFTSPPAIHRFFPNYLLITFSPFPGIDVVHEFWVPESHSLAGRLRIINSGVTPRSLRFDLTAHLLPDEDGARMTPAKMQAVTVLQGQTGGMAPVVFLTGGPEATSSPYPSLGHSLDLLPGLERQYTWVHSALADPEDSFTQTRTIAASNWEAECARIELTNASQVEIYTGEPDWDAALALGQKVALGLIHGPTENLPNRSFVISRGPDQGYSLRGDGSDYNYLWNGQNALDAWYLTGVILPAAPALAAGILRNFLAVQTSDGYVDWKPGLGGQRSRMDATPLLANLAWEIYQTTQDRDFLEAVFPELLTFVLAWFSPYHDRDGDGIPEWDHPMQSGFEDHPIFAYWHPWSQGVDITTSESPALCALLYRECQSLIRIARELDRLEPIPPLEAFRDNLHAAVENAWDGRANTYRHWDRDTHLSPRGEVLVQREGPGVERLERKFRRPLRPQVHIQIDAKATRNARVTIYGRDRAGEPQQAQITTEDIRWYLGRGTGTCAQVFSAIDRVEVEDIAPQAEVTLRSVDYVTHDQSQLLPLWAGIPDRKRAEALLTKAITNPRRFWRKYGLPACPSPPKGEGADLCSAVWMPWNALICEGLLAYGYRDQAAEVVSRLMKAIIANLQREQAFRSHYQVETGKGAGDRNALSGLPPLGLFLKTLGVNLISPWQVALEGTNPFPWPVKVKYRGMTIQREKNRTQVTFANGRTVEIGDPTPCVVDGKASG